MQIEYRESVCGDVPGVYAVETACFTTPWSLLSVHFDVCDNPIAKYIVALDGERIVGFCGLHEVDGEGHITNVAVLPDYRKLGVGKRLIISLLSLTEETITQYTLEVREGNADAIRLNMVLTLVPSRPRMTITTIAIKTRINAYSTKPWPFSFAANNMVTSLLS